MREEMLLPLTRAEEAGKKPVRLVRAAARIAVIAPWPDKYKCLFVRHQSKGLELPGGAIDPGETPLEAGLRELGEEAGIQLPQDQNFTLITMTPIRDHRGGSWLDIVYGILIAPSQMTQQQEPELPVRWLTASEIEKEVNRQMSSYAAALAALKDCSRWNK
ncbi:MAG TPA: NUDIX hydrolase [Ktedonobacteraceae bacterium]|nr:NUDIX hydrolase [Ktedonobacteraceae bacterium]